MPIPLHDTLSIKQSSEGELICTFTIVNEDRSRETKTLKVSDDVSIPLQQAEDLAYYAVGEWLSNIIKQEDGIS